MSNLEKIAKQLYMAGNVTSDVISALVRMGYGDVARKVANKVHDELESESKKGRA